MNENSEILHKKQTVEQLNNYFVNVGHNLAKNIAIPDDIQDQHAIPTNSCSILIYARDEQEILDIARSFKNL